MELKPEIERIFREFDKKILPRVIGNFLTHLDAVIETGGGHIETVLH